MGFKIAYLVSQTRSQELVLFAIKNPVIAANKLTVAPPQPAIYDQPYSTLYFLAPIVFFFIPYTVSEKIASRPMDEKEINVTVRCCKVDLQSVNSTHGQ